MLTDDDRAAIEASGRHVPAAEEQLALLRRGVPRLNVQGACTVGDGIERLDPADYDVLERLAEDSAHKLAAFVPASGAASRMFGPLRNGDADVLARLDELPFADWEPWSHVPKGLVPFHRYDDGVRTAFAEHFHEAVALGLRRLHFTVAPTFKARFAAAAPPGFEVALSTQDPATDTVALADDGTVFRVDGRILFRPGGHGALLQNLEGAGDIVLIKNIDNIVPDADRAEVVAWRKRLVGRALQELERVGRDRPLRVCGMVPNSGQPGGGPFWVDDTPQIVEGAQLHDDQRSLMAAGTHFNPVDMVCVLRDAEGDDFDLHSFADPDAVIVTRKSHDGVPLTALEHPGLWNGGMARWHTVFVELPAHCFRPVKTVRDLLDRV